MRPFHIVLALIAVLPAAAAAQTQAECEYRNPDNPNWNYLRPCSVTAETSGDRTTTTADVNNGSTLTIVEQGAAGALSFRVNGHAATRLVDGASRCYLTVEDEETICIHLDGSAAIGTPGGTADETEVAATEPDTSGPLDLADAGFGGGEAGYCLSWVTGAARNGLIAQGPCTRRTDCAEIEGEGGMSCLTDFVWERGDETVITNQGEVYTLDGAVATPVAEGCFTDDGAGLHFCFSQAKMTETSHPALALSPAPPVAQVAATPAAASETEPPATAQPDDGPVGARCSFLRDDVEVSSWSCTETVVCEAPLCTVTYLFENGTTVTLDTADGQVMLMNGAKADPAVWTEGGLVDVTRPGAPYTFRFSPGAVAASTE